MPITGELPNLRAPSPERVLARTTAYMQRVLHERVPGAQVAVATEDADHMVAVGSARPGRSMRGRTLLPGFCATLPILGLGAAVCARRAGVHLDEELEHNIDLSKTMPAATNATLRQLLEHRAGFNLPVKLQALLLTPEARAALLRRAVPHPDADGRASIYGNYAHPVVLCSFIDQVSGVDAASWLHAEMLEPLGLGDTYFSMSEATYLELRDRLGVHYWVDHERSLPLTVLANEVTSRDFDPAAGGWTTARDLVMFYAQLAAEIRSPTSLGIASLSETLDDLSLRDTRVREPTVSPVDGAALSYVGPFRQNLGDDVSPSISLRAYGHPGWHGTSFAFCDVERKVAVAVLCNWLTSDQTMIDRVRGDLVGAVYEDLALLETSGSAAVRE